MPAFRQVTRMRSPFIRIIIGFIAVVLPVVAVQWLVRQLPLPRPAGVASAALLAAGVAYWMYRAYVRLVEKRGLFEFGRAGALTELAAGLLLGKWQRQYNLPAGRDRRPALPSRTMQR